YRENEQLLLNAALNELDLTQETLPPDTFPEILPIGGVTAQKAQVIMRLDSKGTLKTNLRLQSAEMISSAPFPRPVSTPELRLNVTLAKERQEISLLPTALNYPDAVVGMDFTRIPGKKTEITFLGKRVNLAQGRDASLKFAGWVNVVQHLFDILRAGTARNVSVGFSGRDFNDLWDPGKMVITGTVEKASVKIPNTELTAQDVHGSATMEDGVLKIRVSDGRVGQSRIATEKLDIDIVNHVDVPFYGKFDIQADLATLPDALIRVLPQSELARELARIDAANGTVQASLVLNMETQTDLEVIVNAPVFKGEISYNRVPYPLVVDKGVFYLKDNFLKLKDFAGHINGNPVSGLTGEIRFTDQSPFKLKAEKIRCRVQDFLPWAQSNPDIKTLLLPVTDAHGDLLVSPLTLEGDAMDPRKWRFSIKGNCLNLTTDLSNGPETLKKLFADFEFTNTRFFMENIQGLVKDLLWTQPHIPRSQSDSIPMPLALSQAKILMAPNRAQLQGVFGFPSGVRLDLNLKGNEIHRMMPRKITIADGTLSRAKLRIDTDPRKPRFQFQGHLDSLSMEKLLVPGSHLDKKLKKFTGNRSVKIHTQKNGDIRMDAGLVDLDEILDEEPQEPISESTKKKAIQFQPLFNKKTVHVQAHGLKFKGKTYTELKGKMHFSDRKTELRIERMNLCGLDIKGSLNFFPVKGEQHLGVNIDMVSQPKSRVEKLNACLSPESKLIDGEYEFSCNVKGQGPQDQIFDALNGRVKYQGSNGRIYKMTLLSRLLSVLNLLNVPDLRQKGFAYTTILLEGEIKKGVVELDKAVIDAENMAIFFDGTISPFRDSLDLNSLVAPLKTIDTIIQKIPIISTLLNDRLVSFPAHIGGSISDPTISPLHPEAVGAGILKMVEDILNAPGRIIKETF
ncbi:MAG: AsmA-like C-terminal region-containing protein, partial [Desulfobacterales bacterium]|nr:AsmA-like C-terminal region-containing protein [Desulfobacterales bacterium]